jgi:GTPase SAR1 family protein
MLGLDDAGKTQLLYMCKLGQKVMTIPSIGTNIELLDSTSMVAPAGGRTLQVHDVPGNFGGADVVDGELHHANDPARGRRPLWLHWCDYGKRCLIYVIDATDRARVKEACGELHRIIQEEPLRDAAVLVLANKQDIAGAMSAAEVTEAVKPPVTRQPGVAPREWCVKPTSAVTGDGLRDAIDWVAARAHR